MMKSLRHIALEKLTPPHMDFFAILIKSRFLIQSMKPFSNKNERKPYWKISMNLKEMELGKYRIYHPESVERAASGK
jgi:hypothetical protein